MPEDGLRESGHPTGVAVESPLGGHELRSHEVLFAHVRRRLPSRSTPSVALRELQNPLLRNGLLLTVSSGLSAVVGLCFWTVAAWKYSPATVGSNAAAISMMMLVAAIAQLNLGSAMTRFVPTAQRRTRHLVAGTYLTSGSLAVVVGICSVAAVRTLSPDTTFLDGRLAQALFVVATLAYTIFVIQDSVLTGLRRTALVPVESFLLAAAKLVLLVLLASVMPQHGIFASWVLSLSCAVLVVSTYIFVSAIPRHQRGAGGTDTLPPLPQLARFVAYDYVGAIASMGSVTLLPVLVVAVMGPAQNAYFAIAWAIAWAIHMVNINMGTSLVVETAADQTQLARDARHVLVHTSKLVVPLVIAVIVLAPYVLGVFGHSYRSATDLLRLLAIAVLPNLVVSTAISSARAQRRLGLLVSIQVVQCVSALGLGWGLLHVMGTVGAGWAWLLTQLLLCAVLLLRRDRWLTSAAIPDQIVPDARAMPVRPTDSRTVSVVVCAYTEDRWADLERAVASVQGQTVPPDEIVLSIDHCPGLFARATRELHGVKVIENSNGEGLSGARNAGIAASTGDVVVFLDDDAFAAPDWLATLLALYADSDVLGVGGSVHPQWLTARPSWFSAEFDWVVGCSYRGLPVTRVPVRNFIGANMSLRRSVLVESGGFDAQLGRIGTRPLGCDETELCIRVQQDNPQGILLYEPAAQVWHSVPEARTTWSYYRSRCYSEGLSKAIVRRRVGSKRALASEKSYLTSTIPRAVLHHLGQGLRGRPRGFGVVLAMLAGVATTVLGYGVGTIQANHVGSQHLSAKTLARAVPLAGLPIAVVLWLVSLPQIDLARMGDYGLIPLLPLTYWFGLGLLLVTFGVLVRRGTTATPLLVAHILTLIAMLHATPSVLYGTLRYPWAWKHIGMVDFFLRHKGVDTSVKELAAYQYWPAFFNENAMLVKAGGLQTAIDYAMWAPPFFNVLLIGPLFLIFRTFTDDRRLVWSGIAIFFLGSWVGQDYFAPQACAYFLYLTLVAFCLRYLGRHSEITSRQRRLLVGLAVVPMMAAMVPTHQLTPIMVVSSLAVLVVFCRQRVIWPALIMIGLTLGWDLVFAGPWISDNLSDIFASFGTVGANADSGFVNLAAASHSQGVVARIDRVHSAAIWALALVGFVRRLPGRRELALPLLAIAPLPLIVTNDYGGEMIFRVYLFGLPFVAFYAAAAFFPRETSGRSTRTALAVPAVLLLLVPGFVCGYYGKEQANYVSNEEIAACRFIYSIAPPGSLLVGATRDFPLAFKDFEFYDYEHFAVLEPQDRTAILDDPVDRLGDMMSEDRHPHSYLLLTRSQTNDVQETGALPVGAMAAIEQALTHSPRFTVIYRNPDAVVITLTQRSLEPTR